MTDRVNASAEPVEEAFPTLQQSLFFNTTFAKPVRRKGYPSWSWVGWSGLILCIDELRGAPQACHDLQIATELASGRLISWDGYRRDHDKFNNRSDNPSRFVHVQGYISPVRAIRASGSEKDPEEPFY